LAVELKGRFHSDLPHVSGRTQCRAETFSTPTPRLHTAPVNSISSPFRHFPFHLAHTPAALR